MPKDQQPTGEKNADRIQVIRGWLEDGFASDACAPEDAISDWLDAESFFSLVMIAGLDIPERAEPRASACVHCGMGDAKRGPMLPLIHGRSVHGIGMEAEYEWTEQTAPLCEWCKKAKHLPQRAIVRAVVPESGGSSFRPWMREPWIHAKIGKKIYHRHLHTAGGYAQSTTTPRRGHKPVWGGR